MTISHWADHLERAAYEAAYRFALELWPIPYASYGIATPHGWTHVVDSGADHGDPVVLIHAASLSATQWYPQAAALGGHRRLYAIDIMGDIGLSAQARPIRTRADAAAWLVELLDGLGIDRATFVGSSFGGFHATNLAVLRPDRVRGLILLAPAATVRPFKRLASIAIRTGSLLPLPVTVKPGLRGMMQGALPDRRIVRQMELGVRGFRYDRAGIFPSELPDEELVRLDCPTLLLLGDREMIYDPAEAAERARRLIPRIEAEIVTGVGHLLGMQRPDLVNPRIVRFLDERLATSPARTAILAGSGAAVAVLEAAR